jgi:WD40 repeat protein
MTCLGEDRAMTKPSGIGRGVRARLAALPRWVRVVVPAGALVVALSLALYLLTRPTGPPVFSEGALLDGDGPLCFSPDGGTLACTYQPTSVRLLDVWTGELTQTLEAPGRVRALAFSPDGATLAAVAGYGDVPLWDVRTGERAGSVGERSVEAVAFSPDGRTLACGGTGGSTGTLALWDVRSRRLLRALREPDAAAAAKGPADGWEWASSVELVAFSPDGRLLASSHGGHLYLAVKVWDVRSGRLLRDLRGLTASVHGLAFLPGGKTLVASCGQKVLFWDVRDPEPVGELEVGHWPVSMAVSPDGRVLALGGHQESDLWDLRSRERLRLLDGAGPMTQGVAFSPDGKRFAAVTERGVQLWGVSRSR